MGHSHGSSAAANRNRLVAVLGLSLGIFVVEAVGAFAPNSLALLADAGHMLTDVSGISLALLAIWFAGRAPTSGRSFGYLRLEILAAVANAVLLLGFAAFILFAAWQRLSAPPEVAS
ncbi:MAG: cation diffusion facilitator family transporter [Chloroflexota bacterium]